MRNLPIRLVTGITMLLVLHDGALAQMLVAAQEFTAHDTVSYDSFGHSVAISGDTAVVGAPGDDDLGEASGSAYVFLRMGATWVEQAKLNPHDGAAWDSFGRAVAICGDTVVVGAKFDDDHGHSSGSAYVFRRTGATWTQHAKLTASDAAPGDRFGHSVSVSGDTVVVGALYDGSASNLPFAAYVFVPTGLGWSEQARLIASDGARGDQYGDSVSVSGDTAVIGAPGDDDFGSESGSAYVFLRTGTGWTQQAKLTASDAYMGAWFGRSVSVSGDTALVGASRGCGGTGSAYAFVRSGGTWSEEAKLAAGDAVYSDYFGRSVSLSGDDAVVGAPGDDDHAAGSGSAYLFGRTGAIWRETAKLTPSHGGYDDGVGFSVSISGGTPISGCYGFGAKETGAAFFFVLADYATYCSPAQPNSTGGPAFMTASGSPRLYDNHLNLEITGLPPWQIAKLLMSRSQASIPVGNGTLCLGAQQHRFNPLHHTGASGSLSLCPNLIGNLPPTLGALHSGETWNWQLWYRDTGWTSNFSDALEITLR